jgi:opacity protein-like surface antigen
MTVKNLAIILLLISINTFAQDSSSSIPPLKMKAKFGVFLFANSDFSPDNFIGGHVGLKYFISDKFAVRAGFSIINSSYGSGHPHFREWSWNADYEPMPHHHEGEISSTFGANAYAMFYPLSTGNFTFFGGAGVVYEFYTTPQNLNINGTTVPNPRTDRFGFGGLIGSEYRISKRLNISFEYNPLLFIENDNHDMYAPEYGPPPPEGQPANGPPPPHGMREVSNFNPHNFNLGVIYYFK